MNSLLTVERLKEELSYNSITGVFVRLKVTTNAAVAGAVAGSVGKNGYVHISIGNRLYYAHNLVWLYMTGVWPPLEVDHKNRIRSDNRWDNLRCLTHAQNKQNNSLSSRNVSGVGGVYWDTTRGKWAVQIAVAGKKHSGGRFGSKEKAIEAAISLRAKVHPFYIQAGYE